MEPLAPRVIRPQACASPSRMQRSAIAWPDRPLMVSSSSMFHQSSETSKPSMNYWFQTKPSVRDSDFSGCRFGLPPTVMRICELVWL